MAVQTSQSLAEGLSAVRSISAKPSDAEMRQLEGHLVHLTSPLQTERVTDDQFGVTVEAMRLKRSVRMLQWVERSRQVTSREFDGYGNSREVSRTEYFQVQSWETTVHEMHTFHNSNPQLGGNSHAQIGANGHYQAANYHQGGGAVGLYPPNPPSMPFDSVQVKAASSRAGAFEVTDVLLSQLGDGDKLALRSDKGASA